MEIPETELLDAQAEVRLARLIEAGVYAEHCLGADYCPDGASHAELQALVDQGIAAYQEFYLANLRMVAQLAHQWAKRANLPVEELFQEGCIGLGEAIRRWDHARGLRFSTLAFGMINNTITDAALVRCGRLDTTRFKARSALKIRRAQEQLESELGRSVTLSEVARHLGRDAAAVARTMQVAQPTALGTELDDLASDSDEHDGPDLLPAPVWMVDLPEQERAVLAARYGIGEPAQTRAELARNMGVSQSTLRRIELRALDRARRLLLSEAA
ncbi:MAG: sigma-70 family RNA polymerase sigma factor [Brooklawnia sp.]